MTITKSLKNLEKGTMILHADGYIVLTSKYDSFHDWYEYHDTEIDDDGDIIELQTGGYVTPADLIKDEIC